MHDYLQNPQMLISLMKKMLNIDTDRLLYLLFDNSEITVENSSYDNWNGGTYGYDLKFLIPFEIYNNIYSERESIKSKILGIAQAITEDFSNEFIENILFIPSLSSEIEITEITRKDIFDFIQIEKIIWNGRLSEVDFLKRIYNLGEIKSFDSRFSDAEGDIWQHRINNEDWDEYWILDDDRFNLLRCQDEIFLKFICETMHPVVRNDLIEINRMKQNINEFLTRDNYEIFETSRISGKPIFSGRKLFDSQPISLKQIKSTVNQLDGDYISKQIIRIESSITNDPSLAIGTSKELIESCCKTILSEMNISYKENEDLPKLVKMVAKELRLTPDDISNEAKASEIIKRILSNFASITNGIAELRNSYGSGHGKNGTARGLTPRHAKLAAGAASTLAIFLFETYAERSDS